MVMQQQMFYLICTIYYLIQIVSPIHKIVSHIHKIRQHLKERKLVQSQYIKVYMYTSTAP